MERVTVSFLPRLPDDVELSGLAVVVVDLLRASTTITYALHAGAKYVVPCRTREEALAVPPRLAHRTNDAPGVLLGGERCGVKIDGFDLGNSPAEYTRERVAGRVVAFTTTNGTHAILQSAAGGCVVIGCYANLRVLAQELVDAGRPVHINCAGTGGAVTMEDCLFAGRLCTELMERGYQLATSDETCMARALYQQAKRDPGGELGLMRSSVGGRNLQAIGHEADIELCRREDVCPVVPVFDVKSGQIHI
ncbi:MAG: 2-phosphosulfolactate phosphatase [Pyrinomonadaceae bacterium]|nr:2-phosphosulfolactate phosphatase [Phycisphaerales bacterium]